MKKPVYVMVAQELIDGKVKSGYKWEKLIELGLDGIEIRNRNARMIELIDNQAKEIERLKGFIRGNQNQ